MTIEDQISDEKLQYDINRKAAKIPASSSGKIDKYEYLTGEEISNQQQITEQARFTYSSLGKAFEKQTKTIEDQGKKQVDILVAQKPKEIKARETKPIECGDYFLNGLAKIRESYEPVDFYDVTYDFKDLNIPSVSLSKFKGPLHIFKSIYNGDITLEDVEKEQIELKKDLGSIKHVDPKDKLSKRKMTINNIKSLYNSREKFVQMFNDYAKNISKNIYESKQGTRLTNSNS